MIGRGLRRVALALAGLAPLALAAAPAAASVCQSVARILPGATYVKLAAAGDEGRVTFHFVGHSTYRIETGGGVVIATDYDGWAGRDVIPDVVTMNHAHETHWTAHPDPKIPHVYRGWPDPGEEQARVHEQVGDVLVRNVPTDIRGLGGGVEVNGNSIFIFEVGQLCIGHLGHLHHPLGPDHYAAIGRLDVVMAPVDGGLTLPLPEMIALLKRVRASVVLPMHYWGRSGLDRFAAGMAGDFRIVDAEDAGSLTLTPRTLPTQPTIYLLPEGR